MSLECLEGRYITDKIEVLKDEDGFYKPFMGKIVQHVHSGFFLVQICEDPKMDLSGPMILCSVNDMIHTKFHNEELPAKVFFEDCYEDYNKERVEE